MTGLSIGSRRYELCDGWWLLMTITMTTTTTTTTLAKPLKDLHFCMVATMLMFEYRMILVNSTHAHVYTFVIRIPSARVLMSASIVSRMWRGPLHHYSPSSM
eukprot:COSAG01_NODE_1532_length_10007_cov_4.889842_6_plen_102_part_00